MTHQDGEQITPYEPSSGTAIPTNHTVRMRTNFFYQVFRFIVINIKMVIIIWRSH